MPGSLRESSRRNVRRALAVHVHDGPGQRAEPGRRRARIRRHARDVPEGCDDGAAGGRDCGLEERVAFSTELSPPGGISDASRFKQTLQNVVLVEHRSCLSLALEKCLLRDDSIDSLVTRISIGEKRRHTISDKADVVADALDEDAGVSPVLFDPFGELAHLVTQGAELTV